MSVFCDCNGPPWPPMLRIHVGGYLSHYHLCRRCGTIREELIRADGTISGTKWHRIDSVDLPAAVVEQVRAILSQPTYRQKPLFGGDAGG